ncbi:MAG: Mov34/MPN/PAD-1 family protein [Planctomycetes bacterium]|nr:Mov34/MPN/PAD-1 family protein [Planctomycetota bacterium]
MERHLQWTGQDRCEEVALLAGYVTAGGLGIATTSLLPWTEHGAGYCDLPPDITAGCLGFLKQKGMILLAQVHTHPGRACHSRTDDHGALSDAAGFLSVVVPGFCRFGLSRIFAGGAAIFERMPGGEWRELPPGEVQQRFFLIPESRELV